MPGYGQLQAENYAQSRDNALGQQLGSRLESNQVIDQAQCEHQGSAGQHDPQRPIRGRDYAGRESEDHEPDRDPAELGGGSVMPAVRLRLSYPSVFCANLDGGGYRGHSQYEREREFRYQQQDRRLSSEG